MFQKRVTSSQPALLMGEAGTTARFNVTVLAARKRQDKLRLGPVLKQVGLAFLFLGPFSDSTDGIFLVRLTIRHRISASVGCLFIRSSRIQVTFRFTEVDLYFPSRGQLLCGDTASHLFGGRLTNGSGCLRMIDAPQSGQEREGNEPTVRCGPQRDVSARRLRELSHEELHPYPSLNADVLSKPNSVDRVFTLR
jgi:hypothetical protein